MKSFKTAEELSAYLRDEGEKELDRPVFNVEERIKSLTEQLSNPKLSHQVENFKAALKLYKAGQYPTARKPWYFIDGKLSPTRPKDSDRGIRHTEV